MKSVKIISAAIIAAIALTLSVSAFADEPETTDIPVQPETTAAETTKNNYEYEVVFEDVPLDVPTTVEDKIEFETEEPEISVPADNTIEYDEPQIEIPDTGSKNPFWAVAVCIIGMGAVFALALI